MLNAFTSIILVFPYERPSVTMVTSGAQVMELFPNVDQISKIHLFHFLNIGRVLAIAVTDVTKLDLEQYTLPIIAFYGQDDNLFPEIGIYVVGNGAYPSVQKHIYDYVENLHFQRKVFIKACLDVPPGPMYPAPIKQTDLKETISSILNPPVKDEFLLKMVELCCQYDVDLYGNNTGALVVEKRNSNEPSWFVGDFDELKEKLKGVK